MNEVSLQGFPAHQFRGGTWRRLKARQRKAETMLMAMLHCLSMAVSESEDNRDKALINVP